MCLVPEIVQEEFSICLLRLFAYKLEFSCSIFAMIVKFVTDAEKGSEGG